MTIGKFLTGGAWAAMAAALALTSMPAAARENQGRDRGVSVRSEARQARQDRGDNRGQRAERQQAPRQAAPRQAAPRQQPPRQAPQQRGYTQPPRQAQAPVQRGANRADPAQQRAGRDSNRGNRGDRNATPPRGYADRTDRPAGTAVLSDRNRSYTDRDRNRTYDGRRDGDRNRSNGDRRDGDRNRSDGRRDNDRNWRGNDGSYRDGYRDARSDHRRWDHRSWRNDRRYDWSSYRHSNRNVFRLGRYYSPYRNYSYRRLSIGIHLGSLFYSNRYWINDPWQYRLPAVYGPYRWVRYYDDALLVDIYTGEVVDTIYDFFW